MSYSTRIYLYHQTHRVILLTGCGDVFNRRYQQVYTKTLKAHRGTDNRILFEFVNQDQRPADVIGIEFTFRIISSDGETLLLEKPLEIVNKGKGQARVVLTEEDLDGIRPGLKGFSIEQKYVPFAWVPPPPPNPPDPNAPPVYPPIPNCTGPGNLTGPVDPVNPENFQEVDFEPAYVDDQGGGRGQIEILDSIMPAFVESNILTIPDASGLLNEYDSSIIGMPDKSLSTFQLLTNEFTGTITFQGGSDTDNEWYEILSQQISTTHTGILAFNIKGYHPYLRINFTNASGEVTEIKYR